MKPVLLAWSRSLDLRKAVVSGVSVSLPLTCILFWLDSVSSDSTTPPRDINLTLLLIPTYIIHVVISCIKGAIFANKLHCTGGHISYIDRSLIKMEKKEGLGSILEALRLSQTFFWSMYHLQVHIVDDPVSKIVRKLYLRCLSCTRIVS